MTKSDKNWIYALILEKSQTPVKINIGLNTKDFSESEIKKLIKKGVNVYFWHANGEIPLEIYTSDSKHSLIIFVGNKEKCNSHRIGIFLKNAPKLQKGLESLLQWYFSTCFIKLY